MKCSVPCQILAFLTYIQSLSATMGATVAHYQFEGGPDGAAIGSFVDSGPNALNGSVNGSMSHSSSVAGVGQAATGSLSADSRGDLNYGSVAHDPLFDLNGDFTVELFFRADIPYDNYGSPTHSTLLVKQHTNVPGNFMGSWLIGYNHGSFLATGEIGFGSQTGILLSGTTTLTAGSWHHVALVMDRDFSGSMDMLSLYVNGSLETSQQGIWPAIASGNHPLYVGAGNFATGFERNFDGWMDEVRISDASLASSEFLNAVPEPSMVFLAVPGMLSFAFRRKRAVLSYS